MVWIQRLIVFCFSVSSAYGLGVGGAPWSEEEVWNSPVTFWTSLGGVIHAALLSQVLVVRAKLWRLFSGGHPSEQASDQLDDDFG